MGGGGRQTIGYAYYMGLHMGVCKGPIDAMLAIKAGDRVAWVGNATGSGSIYINAPNLFGGKKREGGIAGQLDLMFGEPTQAPNDYLGAVQGGLNPAYRGLFGTVLRHGLVAAMNPYLKAWAYRIRRIKAGWESGACWYPEKAEVDVGPAPALEAVGGVGAFNPFDPTTYPAAAVSNPAPTGPAQTRILCANPAHVVYEILTDSEDGMGYPPGSLVEDSFRDAADLFHAEGLGLFVKWMQSEKIDATLQNILDHANAFVVQEPTTLKFRLVPMRDDYVLSELPHYGPTAVGYDVPCVLEEFDRSTVEESVNEVTVTWDNSADGSEGSVTVQNLAAIQAAGGVVNQTKAYACCPTFEIARRLAQRDVDVSSAMLARLRIRADRRAGNLYPGLVIRFSWPPLGIQDMAVRVLRVRTGSIDGGEVTIEGVEDVFGFRTTSYVTPQAPGWVDPSAGGPQVPPFSDAFEVPYRDLVQQLGASDAQALDPLAGYLGMVAAKPGGVPVNYDVFTRVGTSGDFTETGTGEWTPTGVLASAIDRDDTVLELSTPSQTHLIQVGSVAFIGPNPSAEAVVVTAITGTQVTVGRGCLDTVPKPWAAGSRVWFYDSLGGASTTEFLDGEVVQAKALTNTSSGQLPVNSGTTRQVTMAQRAARPYPPAAVLANNDPDPASITGPITVTWRHRDRLLQADTVLPQTAASVGPEPGTTYTVRMLDAAQATIYEATGIAGTTHTFERLYQGVATLQVVAVRDGLESWQAQQRTFAYVGQNNTGDGMALAAESNDTLETEDGQAFQIETASEPIYAAELAGDGRVKISDLNPLEDDLAADAVLPIVQGGVNYYLTASQFLAFVLANGGQGEPGKSAYELAVEQGFTGTLPQWLDSLRGADGADGLPGPSAQTFPTASFDGGLGDIVVGASCDLVVPFGFTITAANLVADAAGTLQVDVRVVPFATHPPGPADTICGGSAPTLANAAKMRDTALSGWSTTITSGSVVRFVVTASSGIKRANLVLEGVRV